MRIYTYIYPKQFGNLVLHSLNLFSLPCSQTISRSHFSSVEFESLHVYILLLVFSLIIIIIFIFSLLINLERARLCCNCEICHAYTTLAWSTQFDNLCDWYTHLLQNSPTKTIDIHVLGNTITSNPKNVEYMLNTRFDNYPKGKLFSTILGDFLGRGIFNVDGELWKFQRKMLSLKLGRVSMRMYTFEVVRNEIEAHLDPLLSHSMDKEEGFHDLQDVFRRFSFYCICKLSFGLDPNCLDLSLPISKFMTCFDLASRLSAERAMNVSPWIWKMKRFFNFGSERKLREAIMNINVLAQEVIAQKRKPGFSNQRDLLSQFMSTVNDETYLRDVIISLLLAGRDMVASTLTALFWLLAKTPTVELAILAEANRVIGANEDLKTFEQIHELHYLQATIYESMRLYPPVQFDSKFCLEDVVLPSGSFVKKGTRVTYHPYAMGRMEEIWGVDFLEFMPKRWLKDGVFLQENPFKYPVFQASPRVCLGKEMALVEMKTVVVSLLQRFHIKVANPEKGIHFSPGLTATLSGGLLVFTRARRAPK